MPPTISIVVPVFHPDPAFLHETIHSVTAQTYPHWELLLVFDGPQPPSVECVVNNAAAMDTRIITIRLADHVGISEATNAGVRAARGAYIGFLDHDDLLEPTALALMAAMIAHAPYQPDLLYSDHDKIDKEGRRYEPELKPDWSPETLLSSCYIGHFKVMRRNVFLALGGFKKKYDRAQDYDLLLRLAERTTNVSHLPYVLYHWRSSKSSTSASASQKCTSIECGRRAVEEALKRRNKRGKVVLPSFAQKVDIGVYSLSFDPQEFTEHITILIPTKNRPDLLEPCIRSIRQHTVYPHYDILVANNGNTDTQLTTFLQKEGVQKVDVPTDGFNFSSVLNTAMKEVYSSFVLFLNNDTEVLNDTWLLQMMGILMLSDHIGAVGAKLLFPDGHTQHSGLILGLNDFTAGHAHRRLPSDDSGYRNANRALRNFSAVTAACMLTRTELFREVGGFDEVNLPIAYNDVDYCLKILAHGYRTVVQPDALLLHHQASSRGATFHPSAEYASRAYLRRMWGPLLRADPYYNPNLSRHNEHFLIRSHPLGKRILFASHNLAYEGASLSLLELATALKERDYHVEVTSPQPGPLENIYAERGIPLHIGRKGNPHPLLALNRDVFDLLFLNTITNYELLQNADISAHPTIWCIRESERDTYSRELPDFSPTLFSAASRVLFVSHTTQEVYHDLDRGHFQTIHTGIDIARIDAASQQRDRSTLRYSLGIAATDIVITTIGTICPRKGQKGFVDAAIALLHSSPQPLHFLLVGSGTESTYEREIQKHIRQSGFSDRIHLVEKTSDVDRYYAASDVFVCNSSIESFPRVILEAMAWQLPIVATNVFGIPEQVQDEQEALLVPPGNTDALTHAIHRLLEDPNLRTTLAQNARARVEKEFNIERMTDQYEQLFRELCPFGVTTHRGIAATIVGR